MSTRLNLKLRCLSIESKSWMVVDLNQEEELIRANQILNREI